MTMTEDREARLREAANDPALLTEAVISCGVGLRHAGATLDDFKPLVREHLVAAAGGRSLYLYGAPGSGKTHALAALVRYMAQRGAKTVWQLAWKGRLEGPRLDFAYGCGPRFVNVPVLLGSLKAAMAPGAERSSEEILADLAAAPTLILDDLGSETPTEWAVETIFRIVDDRYSAMKHLIVTGNLSIDALARHLGRRTADRLADMAQVVELQGNWRRR
jgi:DNA replication protein DnaC